MMLDREAEMRNDYDFRGAHRAQHHRAYREGHLVRVFKADGTVETKHFTLAEGAVMLDPDVRAMYRDSEAVNRALRTLGYPRSA